MMLWKPYSMPLIIGMQTAVPSGQRPAQAEADPETDGDRSRQVGLPLDVEAVLRER